MKKKKTLTPDPSPTRGEGGQTAFSLGAWHGMQQWKCSACEWDTLEGEQAMLAHYAARHVAVAPPEAPRSIQVYDRWGNPVK